MNASSYYGLHVTSILFWCRLETNGPNGTMNFVMATYIICQFEKDPNNITSIFLLYPYYDYSIFGSKLPIPMHTARKPPFTIGVYREAPEL